jgi:hypothetical protein
MNRHVLAVSALSLITFGCASVLPPRVPEASRPFEPTGSVKRIGGVATFDAVRVRGPGVEMTKRTDGSWGGRVQAWEIEASVSGNTIAGVETRALRPVSQSTFTMHNSGDEQDMVVDGILDHYEYHFEVHPDRVVIGAGARKRVLMKNDDNTYGPNHNVSLGGDAGGGLPPWPQIAFAMLGTEPATAFFHDHRRGYTVRGGENVDQLPTPQDYAPAL